MIELLDEVRWTKTHGVPGHLLGVVIRLYHHPDDEYRVRPLQADVMVRSSSDAEAWPTALVVARSVDQLERVEHTVRDALHELVGDLDSVHDQVIKVETEAARQAGQLEELRHFSDQHDGQLAVLEGRLHTLEDRLTEVHERLTATLDRIDLLLNRRES